MRRARLDEKSVPLIELKQLDSVFQIVVAPGNGFTVYNARRMQSNAASCVRTICTDSMPSAAECQAGPSLAKS